MNNQPAGAIENGFVMPEVLDIQPAGSTVTGPKTPVELNALPAAQSVIRGLIDQVMIVVAENLERMFLEFDDNDELLEEIINEKHPRSKVRNKPRKVPDKTSTNVSGLMGPYIRGSGKRIMEFEMSMVRRNHQEVFMFWG